MAERKEYEMSDKFKLDSQKLLDKIELREKLAERLKIASPLRRAETIKQLAALDRHIDKFEQSLADEYEITQKKNRLEEEYEAQMEEMDKLTNLILEDMKKKAPELYRKIKADLDEIDNDENE